MSKTYTRLNLQQLLGKKFTLKDKIPIKCVSSGDFPFREGKEYNIYMSTGVPRVYDSGSKQYYESSFKNISRNTDLPVFDIFLKHLDVPIGKDKEATAGYQTRELCSQSGENKLIIKKEEMDGTHYLKIPSGFISNLDSTDVNKMVYATTGTTVSFTATLIGENIMLQEKILNRLNGISLSEEKLVELSQEVSEDKVIAIDIVKLLKDNPTIKNLNLGKDSLVKKITFADTTVRLELKMGNVTKESNGKIAKAIKELLSKEEE